jgi:hypothetical protein
MAYADYQSSREGGNPVQLFLFRYGTETAEYYAYTDHTEELTVDHGGSLGIITYAPVPIERDAITSNGTLDKSAIKLNTDVGTDLAEIFRVYPPAAVVTLTIYEGHLDDTDEEYVVTWAGRVITASRNGGELQLSGEPVSTSMRRPGLRYHYQYGCPKALYSTGVLGCNADKAAATVTAAVASITGATVTLSPGWEGAFDPTKFLGGLLEWTPAGGSTDRRTILRVSGDTLSLSGVPRNLAVSDSVNVVLGCNHDAFTADGGDCQGLHDNLLNYGGCKWIPTKNPIGTYNNYF